MWLLILPLFPALYSQNGQYPFVTILESTFLFPLPTASYLWRLYNPIIADVSQWLLSPLWITDWDWGARKAFTTYSAYTPLCPIVSPRTSCSAFSNLRACLELEASSVTSSIRVSRWMMFSPSCLLFNSCLSRSTWRALFGPPVSSLAQSPFRCRYLSTWARSLFHLLARSQFAQAIASALSSLLGFLGAGRSSSLEELLSSEDGAFFFVFFFFVFLGGSLLLGVGDE